MITVEDAEKTILYNSLELDTVLCPLSSAHGKVLGEDIFADRDLPPYDRVTIDGIAIAFPAWQQGHRRFRIEGTAQAGEPRSELQDRNAGCIEHGRRGGDRDDACVAGLQTFEQGLEDRALEATAVVGDAGRRIGTDLGRDAVVQHGWLLGK